MASGQMVNDSISNRFNIDLRGCMLLDSCQNLIIEPKNSEETFYMHHPQINVTPANTDIILFAQTPRLHDGEYFDKNTTLKRVQRKDHFAS